MEGGGWSTLRPGCYTRTRNPASVVEESGWAPGQDWIGEKNLAATYIIQGHRKRWTGFETAIT